MPQPPEALVQGKQRPFTGAEFLASLRDGREVYIYGERVKDVTSILPSATQPRRWLSSTTRCTPTKPGAC